MGDVVDGVDQDKAPASDRGETGRMARNVRLDAPGALHPGIVRSIARGRIVADRTDRAAFVARHTAVSPAGISKTLSRAGK